MPNLDGRINGLNAAKQNKIRAQASTKMESDRGFHEMQGQLKKLASQELMLSMGTAQTATALQSSKKLGMQKSKHFYG